MVVVGHSWSLLGIPGVPMLGGITIHHLGVYIFFSIEWVPAQRELGALPQARRVHDPPVPANLPALMLVVLVTVFIAGPALTSLPAAAYWGSGQTLASTC